MGKQRDASHSREIAGLVELGDRLGEAVPASPAATIVHGDYRLDNVIVDPAQGRILAVLDWEMATLGDPLADVGLSYLYWIGWEGIDNPIATSPGAHANFPAWDELATRYAADTGYRLDDLDWYIAFGFYKLAVILEGIHYRHVHGLTVGGGDYDYIGPMVPTLVERGLAAAG